MQAGWEPVQLSQGGLLDEAQGERREVVIFDEVVQVDVEQLKTNAQVVPEVEKLGHVDHVAALIRVLQAASFPGVSMETCFCIWGAAVGTTKQAMTLNCSLDWCYLCRPQPTKAGSVLSHGSESRCCPAPCVAAPKAECVA